jgi:hypothetical protein
LVGVLVIGAVAAWALPNSADAAYGGRWGGNQGAGAAWTAPGSPDTAYGGRQGQGRGAGAAGAMPATPALYPAEAGPLSESEVEALLMALDDEYKAWSVYDQVIADFGAVRPFTNIQRAEANHIAALVALFDRYGLDVPENEWPGSVPAFDTLSEACEAGVQAEIDNADLYDQLFGMADNSDILQVFGSLQQASQTKHLPAFESCAP